MRKLFLDDIRMPGDVTWIALHDGPYDVVRNFDQFTAYVTKHGIPDVISFDNDLGIDRRALDSIAHFSALLAEEALADDPNFAVMDDLLTDLRKARDRALLREGKDCAKWLVEQVLDGELEWNPQFQFTVHSKNIEAAKDIRVLLSNFSKAMANGFTIDKVPCLR